MSDRPLAGPPDHPAPAAPSVAATHRLAPLTPVALQEDLPEHGLRVGQVGTVVRALGPGRLVVRFGRPDGPVAIVSVRPEQVSPLAPPEPPW